MKDRKGFTLVEMIFVLSVLVIIFLTVIPEIGNLNRKSKENEYQRFLSDIFLSTEAYIQKNIDNYPNLNYQNKKVYVYFDELLESGYLKSTVKDPKNNKSVKEEDFTVQVFIDENNEYKYKLYEERYSCSIEDGTEYIFDYTNGEQEFVAECDGTYKLETWGAQGGSYNTTCIGGYGAYSVGNLYLNKNDNLFINVGGSGSGDGTHKTQAGGYNGGGSTTIDSDAHTRQSSGGGATHIAAETGLLSTFENNKSSIYIVSSGGGGSAANSVIACSTGGSGGGIKGNTGQKFYESETVWGIGNGGTQEIGGDYSAASYTLQFTDYIGKGSFGKGATTVYVGGGAGLFGGGAVLPSAGGGSSYIGNSLLTEKSMYCYNCEESSEESTLTISTTGTNELLDKTNCSTGYSSSPVSKCAKAGNGYAKITYLGN